MRERFERQWPGRKTQESSALSVYLADTAKPSAIWASTTISAEALVG